MTAFDRIERRLPEVLDDLGAPNIPDYFDDMLRATARTRQRPAWSAPERWLPMGVMTRPLPLRPIPWRPIVAVALVALLTTAALLYAGSRTRVPPPFGPARNGAIVYGTADGDIASWDPVTNETTTIISGAAVEQFPVFSLDGTRLVFGRTEGTTAEADFLADADGSDIRSLLPSGPTIRWYDESGSGDRALLSRDVDGVVVQSMVDMATGRETPLGVDPLLRITLAQFRPAHDQVIYEHVPDQGGAGTTVYLADGNGAGPLRPIAISPDATSEAWPSPDGSKLVYTTWATEEARQGRIHVVDLDSGVDTALMFDGSAGTIELSPLFSPDSKHLVLTRFGEKGLQLVIVPADGVGPAVPIGPAKRSDGGGANVLWSPDGTQVLAAYQSDGSVWLLPANGADGRKLDELSWDRGVTWQRLAP